MAKVIEVIYENGVFKPLQKVDLKEGQIVTIEIKEKRISKRFYQVLKSLECKSPKVENAIKILEEIRE